MKTFILSICGIVFGFLIVVFIIYVYIRRLLNENGFRGRSILDLYREAKRQAMLDKSRHKEVSGMTNVLLPTIKRYFPDFNENEFYVLTETCIRKILMAIENQKEDLLDDDSISLMKEKLKLQIRKLSEHDIKYKYRDILFHKHAIKEFKKDDGKATIIVSSALEYYYEEYNGDEIVIKEDYKKQTRYQTEFVFVYDIQKAGYDIKAIGLNCPNCGGPINGYAQKLCNYCKTGIDISMLDFKRAWKVVDLKEDY